MPDSKIKVDIHGSCVSRNLFNVEEGFFEVKHNFSRNNIVSCMMPPTDITVKQEELMFSSDYSYRCIKNALDKSTLSLLLQSDSDFLVIDLYDFCQNVAAYENTTFSTYDYSVLLAPSLQPYMSRISQINFLDLPKYLWYGYVDLYFSKIKERFNDRIILVRLCCCNKYISRSKEVLPTPARLLGYGNANYNQALRELEDYIIERHDPYVIDVTKYFIADESYNADVTPVHFEKNYQIAAWNIIKYIILKLPMQKYFDCLPASIVSALLLLPVSTEDYRKIWEDVSLPFSSFEFLDELCRNFTTEELLQNRHWLASLYGYCKGNPLGAAPESVMQDIDDFMSTLIVQPQPNDFSKMFVDLLKQKYHILKKEANKLPF